MKTNWLLALLSAVSLSAFTARVFADTQPLFPVLTCPAVGDEYEQMLSKLDGIKTAIKKDANCYQVEIKVNDLQDRVVKDREKVMQIVNNAGGQPLSPDDSKLVRDYAENVTKQVAALNDLFTRSNYCFRGDQPENQITTLAGFVSEASQLVGSLSGPWGTPIALAGNVVAGFMTGMDQIFKTRAGYDFSKADEWKSYVQNLCTYHSFRDQIAHLLNPQERLAQLNALKAKLDQQIDTMVRSCDECRSIRDGYATAKDQNFTKEVQSADGRFSKPYGTYTIQNLGLRDWVNGEIARVQREANSYWADASGRHLLTQAKSDIEQFLIEKEAPKFLSYGITQSRSDYNDFLYFAGDNGRALFGAFYQVDPGFLSDRGANLGWSDPLSVFRALVIKPIAWNRLASGPQTEDLQFSWAHYRDQGLNSFHNAETSTQVVQTFCSFFKHAGFYSPAIRAQCASTYFNRLVSVQEDFAKELKAADLDAGAPVNSYIAIDDDNYSLNRLEALTKKIEQQGIGD